jgi:hypothetical protein
MLGGGVEIDSVNVKKYKIELKLINKFNKNRYLYKNISLFYML